MKGKKLIISALVASMVGAPVAVLGSSASAMAEKSAPLTNEDNGYTVVGPNVRVNNKYQKRARKGEEITVPHVEYTALASNESFEGYTKITIINPHGETVKVVDAAKTEEASAKFQAEIEGVYTYRFESYVVENKGHATDEERTSIVSTYELYCEVEGDAGSLEIPENSYYVIPTQFKKGETLEVPMPTTFLNDKEVVFTNSDTVEVMDEDGNKTYAVIKALLYVPGSTEPVPMDFVGGTNASYNTMSHFKYGVGSEDTAIGTYKLEYRLYNVANSSVNVFEKNLDGTYKYKAVAISNKKSISVKSNLTSDKLFISWGSQPKKSAEVGNKYNLVSVNATFAEGSTDYENVFTQITVKHQESGKMMDVNYEDMSFVPTEKGNYFVTYKALIPSLGIESNVLTYSITEVDDTTKPVLYLTESYNIDKTGDEWKTYVGEGEGKVYLDGMEKDELLYNVKDASHYVKSYYRMEKVSETEASVTVKIPAAYVTDNYSNLKNMTVTRNLYKRTNTTDSGKLQLIKSDNTEYAFNEVAEYTFINNATKQQDGNYVVKYVYTDENGESVTSDFNITIKPYTDDTVKGEPKVTFVYDDEIVEIDDTIKFDMPTATDEYDTNLKLTTYYGFSDLSIDDDDIMTHVNSDTTFFKEFNYNHVEEGDYTLDIKTEMGATRKTYLYLVSVAENSYDDNYTVGKNVVVKKVLILGGIQDDNAPVYQQKYTADSFNEALVEANVESGTIVVEAGQPDPELDAKGFIMGDTKALFNQDDVITIPEVSFKDSDKYVTFDIKVSYANGDEVVELGSLETDFNIVKDDVDPEIYHINGASFRASYAKTYTITVSAADSNGNVTYTSFAVRVNDTQPPVIAIENESKFSETVELGSTFIIPEPTVYDNDTVLEDAEWSWEVATPNAPKDKDGELIFANKGQMRKFVPSLRGTYLIRYRVKDNANIENVSSVKYLNVEPTAAPVITVAPIENNDRAWDNTKTQQAPFEIPMATAKEAVLEENGVKLPIEVDAPVVKNSKGTEIKVSANEAGTMWVFTPDVQGEYTITYSAQGRYLSATKVLSVNIGDGQKPTMEWTNKEEDFVATATAGDSWTFKFDMIDVEDNESDMMNIINNILDKHESLDDDAMAELKNYVNITMRDSSNKTISGTPSNGGLTYTFENSGTYTFKIVLKDEAGNSTNNTYSYTINVNEKEEAEEKENESVVGTVLIVLSVVILAGVVAYFVITTKQVETKGKKADKKADKKDEK